jgi:hypothetical protein
VFCLDPDISSVDRAIGVNCSDWCSDSQKAPAGSSSNCVGRITTSQKAPAGFSSNCVGRITTSQKAPVLSKAATRCGLCSRARSARSHGPRDRRSLATHCVAVRTSSRSSRVRPLSVHPNGPHPSPTDCASRSFQSLRCSSLALTRGTEAAQTAPQQFPNSSRQASPRTPPRATQPARPQRRAVCSPWPSRGVASPRTPRGTLRGYPRRRRTSPGRRTAL